MNIKDFASKPTYAPLEDGIHQAQLLGFAMFDNEKGGYLQTTLLVNNAPHTVNLFDKSIGFAVSAFQRILKMDGATGVEVFNAMLNSNLSFPITVEHANGFRNIYFYERALKLDQPQTNGTDETDCPM